jgi:hypoxanthine phosphoribosyltransferase
MRQTQTIISSAQIEKKTIHLAKQIAQDYRGKNVILIGILKGSVIFLSDLLRALWHENIHDCCVDFMGISSYGSDTESSKNPHITKDLDMNIHNRHALIVEDIIDTGYSLDALYRILHQRQPKSLKTVVLLSKPSRRQIDIKVDYLGFEVEGWVEGYGLDTDELYRGRPDIIEVIKP